MSIRTFVSKWMPVIAWMILIFAGSTDALSAEHTSRFLIPFLRWLDPQISFQTIAAIHFALRKLGHLTEYAILAALLWRAWRGSLRSTRLRQGYGEQASEFCTVVISLGIAAMFAMSDEFHQSFVPTRTPSENDVLIDICGAVVGLTICLILARRRKLAFANRRSTIENRQFL
jgi:VanZ family protein